MTDIYAYVHALVPAIESLRLELRALTEAIAYEQGIERYHVAKAWAAADKAAAQAGNLNAVDNKPNEERS